MFEVRRHCRGDGRLLRQTSNLAGATPGRLWVKPEKPRGGSARPRRGFSWAARGSLQGRRPAAVDPGSDGAAGATPGRVTRGVPVESRTRVQGRRPAAHLAGGRTLDARGEPDRKGKARGPKRTWGPNRGGARGPETQTEAGPRQTGPESPPRPWRALTTAKVSKVPRGARRDPTILKAAGAEGCKSDLPWGRRSYPADGETAGTDAGNPLPAP